VCTYEDGRISDAHLFSAMKNPKYVTTIHGEIAALGDFPNGSGIALINQNGDFLDAISYEDRTSCYIAAQDSRLFTANYHEGTVSVLNVINNRMKLLETIHIQDGAGAHQVLFWKDQILVPCLFLDRIMIYDSMLNSLGSIRFDVGTGPRHGVFTKDEEYLYLASELSNELFVIHAGDWKVEHRIPVLPDGETHVRDTAAIRLSDDEKTVYVSTRTKDILSVISIHDDHTPELVQTVSTGEHPRDFILLDHHLLCANRYSNNIICYELNEDGTIGNETSEVEVPEVVSLAVIENADG
jgi:6-phosphogluconolactonase (cycloisomerase 2 family)